MTLCNIPPYSLFSQGWLRDKLLSSWPTSVGTESRSPRDRANLYHTGSQVTQSPEQLPQTQKGNNDPT